MSPADLPFQLGQMADWEYGEVTVNGGTTQIEITKSGVIPVVSTGGILQLSDPTRAGVAICVVLASKTTGASFGVTSATGNIYVQAQDFGIVTSSQYYFGNMNGVYVHFMSMPIYIGGVRTYRWVASTIPG